MALNSLFCADVPLSNYSLTHVLSQATVLRRGVQNCGSRRAPTVGDTSGNEIDWGCDGAAWALAGGKTDVAETSVPEVIELSMSCSSWSIETSDKVATTGGGEHRAGCSTADAEADAGDGMAAK